MSDYGNKTACMIDHGLFTHLAERAAQEFGRMLYFVPTAKRAFNLSRQAMVGTGLENIERIADLWDHVDEVDLFIVPDINHGDLTEYLRGIGKPVFGMGKAERMERDRWKFRQFQQKANMPIPDTEHVKGLDNLRAALKDAKDVFVKASEFRGDCETFHVDSLPMIEPFLAELEHEFGAAKNQIEFLIEQPVPAEVEVGYDGFVCDGKLTDVAGWGYEVKDKAYLGKIGAYSKFPKPLRYTTGKLLPLMKDSRGMFSSEIRLAKDGTPYLIDPTFRCGSPPSEAQVVAYDNWGDLLWGFGNGEIVTPSARAEYLASVIVESDFADDNWMPVTITAPIRQHVALHNHARIDGVDYSVPQGSKIPQIGALSAVGQTPAEACQAVNKLAEQLNGFRLIAHVDALDEALKVAEKGKQMGLGF